MAAIKTAKKQLKTIKTLLLHGASIAIGVSAPTVVLAQSYILNAGGVGDTIQSETGLGSNSPESVATTVINTVLSALAIIATVLIIISGLKWMTSNGNEDKVTNAKDMLKASIIGLGIVMAAWGISIYFVGVFSKATGTTTS